MKIGILRCGECGSEIQRTLPFPEFLKPIVEELYRRVTSLTCPRGCNPPAFRGFTALNAPGWRSVLGLDGSANLDQVESRFRELAHQYHPDKGGDAERFHEIVKAREEARRELGAA